MIVTKAVTIVLISTIMIKMSFIKQWHYFQQTNTHFITIAGSSTAIRFSGMDNVFVEWSDGKLSSFSGKQVLKSIEKIV